MAIGYSSIESNWLWLCTFNPIIIYWIDDFIVAFYFVQHANIKAYKLDSLLCEFNRIYRRKFNKAQGVDWIHGFPPFNFSSNLIFDISNNHSNFTNIENLVIEISFKIKRYNKSFGASSKLFHMIIIIKNLCVCIFIQLYT